MNKNQYIREIINRSCLPGSYRKKIKEDLQQEFNSYLSQGYSENEVMKRMGEPDALAASIYENYVSTNEITRPFLEYKSKTTFLGLPLVHIVKGKRKELFKSVNCRQSPVPTAKGILAIGRRAKGIIAIGNLSMGVISIGNLSLGVLSISNIGLGLFAFGNLVIGLFMVIGNLAFGSLSLGNIAMGYGTVGNASLGFYTIGRKAVGINCLEVKNYLQASKEIYAFIENLPKTLQPFFQTAMIIINNSEWLVLFASTFLVLFFIAWFLISQKLESKDKVLT